MRIQRRRSRTVVERMSVVAIPIEKRVNITAIRERSEGALVPQSPAIEARRTTLNERRFLKLSACSLAPLPLLFYPFVVFSDRRFVRRNEAASEKKDLFTSF